MKNASNKVFFGKLGKIFGPFDSAEVEAMQASGKIHDFTWIWNGEQKEWRTLETPPPAPASEVPGQVSAKARADMPNWDEIEALCHDSSHVVSGALTNVTETGCELITHDHSASPVFAVKAAAVLNLMNGTTGTSTNIPVRMLHVARVNNSWVYRIAWNEAPSLKSA